MLYSPVSLADPLPFHDASVGLPITVFTSPHGPTGMGLSFRLF